MNAAWALHEAGPVQTTAGPSFYKLAVELLPDCLVFFACFFSLGVNKAFFFTSLLGLRSFDMILVPRVRAYGGFLQSAAELRRCFSD